MEDTNKDLPIWFRQSYWCDNTEPLIENVLTAPDKENFNRAIDELTAMALGERDSLFAEGSKWAMMGMARIFSEPTMWPRLKEYMNKDEISCLSEALWYLNQIRLKNIKESVRYWPSPPPHPDNYHKLMAEIYRNPIYWKDEESKKSCLKRAEEVLKEYSRRGY